MLEVISARAAFDAGLKRYFTGKPCGNGHLAERMISNGSCVQCLADRRKLARSDAYERVKAWRLSNPGARASEAEKYRKAHPDAVKRRQKKYCDANRELRAGKTAAWRGRMRATNPEGEKARLAKWAQRAREKRAREAGRSKPTCCEICGRSDLRIVWDHCHASGRFPGLDLLSLQFGAGLCWRQSQHAQKAHQLPGESPWQSSRQ